MYQTTNLPNSRLHIADVLRGIAVMGIILIHNVEHMEFYNFPEATSQWMIFLDKMTWNGVFFAIAGKMYSIFALMFGLSFFIQNDNRMQKGKSFAWRFEWRMLLLLVFGLINTFFYSGDILVSYAIFGMLMPLVSRLNTKTVAFITIFLLIQPIEIFQLFAALFNPDYTLIDANSGKFFKLMFESKGSSSLWEYGWHNLRYGQLGSFAWNFENGRITQIPGLFCLGMLMGRIRLLYNEKDNLKTWIGILAISILVFFPLYGLLNMLPDYISRKELLIPGTILLKSWSNLGQMFTYVSLLTLLFYSSKFVHASLMKLTDFGRSSMTNYFLQSILGSILYHGWAFGLYRYSGHTASFLTGICMIIVQYHFCRWWLTRYSHGPMEGLWKKLTWIKIK